MLQFAFVDDIDLYDATGKYCVFLDAIDSEELLLQEYNRQLQFPFFGFNWDALNDSLRYLDNIPQYDIVLLHKTLPQLADRDLWIYLDILNDTITFWGDFPDHNVQAIFCTADRDRIIAIFSAFNK